MRTRIITAIALLLAGSIATAQKWPSNFKAPQKAGSFKVVDLERNHYRSAHFDLISFKNHSKQFLADFFTCAESVPLVLEALPLPLLAPSDRKAKIVLHPTRQAYLADGGAGNTAGFYDSRRNVVLLQWEKLFQQPTESGGLPTHSFDLTIHELTHLSMHRLIPHVEVWLSEGIAEYLAATYQGKGKYQFDQIDQSVIRRLNRYRRAGDKAFTLPPLSKLLLANQRDWLRETAGADPYKAIEPYRAALLLVHFSFHGGGERLEKTRKHLTLAHEKKRTRPPLAPLYQRDEAAKIEAALAAYWSKKGIQINFRKD